MRWPGWDREVAVGGGSGVAAAGFDGRGRGGRADLWSTGVSVRHPVEFVRMRLEEAGCLTVADALAARRNGTRVRGWGRHPPAAPWHLQGVVFINLEDETGLLNVVVMPDIWDAQRDVARRAVGMIVEGTLEHRDGVTNLIARRFSSWPVEGVRSRDWAVGVGGRR